MTKFVRTQLKRYTYFQQAQYQPVLDADGNPVIDEDSGEAETTLAEPEAFFYGNFFPVEVEPTTYTTGLYLIDYNTQAAGKFKLWRANEYWLKINSTAQQTVTSPLLFRSNTAGTQLSIIGNDIKLFTDNYTGAGKGYYKGREIVSEVDNDANYYVRHFNKWFKTIAGTKMTLTPDASNGTFTIIHQNTTRTNTANALAAGTGIINSITTDATGHITATTYTDLINRAKKLDHTVTINLTDADIKNGVKGTVTTDFSGNVINIPTEISPIDASKITSGIIDIERLPQGVLERLIPVANQTARFALTKAQVQNGDTVKQIDTGEMWYVKDDTKLNSAAGYEVYTSGRASSVPWTGVEGKPTQITLSTDLSGSIALGAGPLTLASTIVANAVTNAKLADMGANTIKGRQTSAGDPQDLNPAQIRAMLNIADGANKYIHPAYTVRGSGFYKFNVDATGHVPSVTAVTNADIMGLHSNFTAVTNALYKVTVDGKGHVTGTVNAAESDIMGLHTNHTAYGLGLYKITVNSKGHVTSAALAAPADIMGLHSNFAARAAGFYKVTVDGKGHVSNVAAVTKGDITGLGIPGSDTVYTHPAYTARAAGFYKVTVDALGHVSNVASVTKADITALGIPGQDTNTTYGLASTTANGLLRQLNGNTSYFMRGDGNWAVPPNTTYANFTRNVSGLIPAPGGTTTTRYMREDGQWATPPDTNTTYGLATTSANGLLRQLNNNTGQFLRGDGVWATPPATDLSNYVTLNTAQSITGKKTMTAISIGGVTIEWNGSETGTVCFNYGGKHMHFRPAGKSTMDGSLYVAGGGYGSDNRFKTNIREIDISKADLISFHKFLNTRVNHESAGVIAQELETIYPEFVLTDESSTEKYKYVDYNGVFSVKIASHDEKIKQLQNKSINIDFLNKLSIRSLLKLILLKILNKK